jgi:hypothetical protein
VTAVARRSGAALACAEPRAAGVSPAKPASPRDALLAALSAGMTSALASGDAEAARVAHDAIGKLLGAPGAVSAVIYDLAVERERRAGG